MLVNVQYEKLINLLNSYGFEFSKCLKSKTGRPIFIFKFKENEKIIFFIKIEKDKYKFMFTNIIKQVKKDNLSEIEKTIKLIKDKCTKITYSKINLMAIDTGNLYPVSIAKFDSSKDKLTCIQVDIKDKMFIKPEKLSLLFNKLYYENKDKFKVLKDNILPNLIKINNKNISKFKLLKNVITQIYEKHIEKFNGIIIIGHMHFFDNVRKLVRYAKLNKNVKAKSELQAYFQFKKFYTFLFTGFVNKYLKKLLLKDKKEVLIVDEAGTSSYFYNFPIKDIDTNKKLVFFNNYVYCLNSDFLACINMMRVNKYFDEVIKKKIKCAKNLKLFDSEIIYNYDIDENKLVLKK